MVSDDQVSEKYEAQVSASMVLGIIGNHRNIIGKHRTNMVFLGRSDNVSLIIN